MVPISQVDGWREAFLSGEVCYMLSAMCTTEITGLGAADTYDV